VGAVFDAANRVANGERATIGVNVRATSPGSFQILFEVAQVAQQSGLIPDVIESAVGIKQLLFGGSGGAVVGLIALIKYLRGRKYSVSKINEKLFRLTVDGETYDVPLELLRQYEDANVRKGLAGMFQPLREPGIDIVQIRENNQVVEEVEEEHLGSFEIQTDEEITFDEVNRRVFSISALSFKSENKWRLTDGNTTFSVSMSDDAFRQRVANNEESFSSGDVLVCDLRTVQRLTKGGVKTDYEVIKVIEHKTVK
jgi:hypothetical protein